MDKRSLTKELLIRNLKRTGNLNEELAREVETKKQETVSSPEITVPGTENVPNNDPKLQETQNYLMELKQSHPQLTEHIDRAYLQLGQIISILKGR